jgi:hypothetical protein
MASDLSEDRVTVVQTAIITTRRANPVESFLFSLDPCSIVVYNLKRIPRVGSKRNSN